MDRRGKAIKETVVKKTSSRTRIEDYCVIGLFMESWDTLSQVIKVHGNSLGCGQWSVPPDESIICKHLLRILLTVSVLASFLRCTKLVHRLRRKHCQHFTLCFISPEEVR